ncbi:Ff.00g099330.m01.CDS01 [Fusarium sp. VM40]|nr:Ff.00g099330.m01.CDS01 [Fusarium sp. VM40]
MKTGQIRFRFWQGNNRFDPDTSAKVIRDNTTDSTGGDLRRSRSGCVECKRRRVKCDETFPVCTRCQKRGSICQSATRLTKWQQEAPWIKLCGTEPSPSPFITHYHYPQQPHAEGDDQGLLRYWLERASQIMVIDPDENPLSFPILEHVQQSPTLKHALQSVGAGHLNYFAPEKLSRCLEERSTALRLIMNDLLCPGDNLLPLFLSIFLVGLSTAWTNGPEVDFGQQHLQGARALVDMVLDQSTEDGSRPLYTNLVIGSYLYWDMATAFLVPLDQQKPLNTSDIYSTVLGIGNEYHPIGGYTTGIFYLIGNVGRYCRSVVETGIQDELMESALEDEMIQWEPNCEKHELSLMCDAFRSHGLLSLAAICYRRRNSQTAQHAILSDIVNTLAEEDRSWWQSIEASFFDEELEASIRNRALDVIHDLLSIPSSHPCTNLQAIPMFTAASELTSLDKKERSKVQERFKELYSLNHIPANLAALRILPEIWERRDAGDAVNWLEVMIEKGWNLMLG